MRTLVIALVLLHGTMARVEAQKASPWVASLSMSRPAVGVGECNVINLDLKSGTSTEWPRGPNGNRVSMADFDFSVTAPVAHAAVGKYDGPNNFAVCACPKAPAGTVVTVTATYPSQTIAPKAKVEGVSFTTSMSAPIIAGASSGNPPGCDDAGATTMAWTGKAMPWTVTVQPPALLPIGSCSALLLTLRDSTGKDWPRTPAGSRVSVTDFDFTAKAANGADVVTKSNGGGGFLACACQSGKVGEAATVTAMYPAAALAEKALVPGVALSASAPFALAAAPGSADPAGCGASQPQQIARAGAPTGAAVGSRPTVVTGPPTTIAAPGASAAPAGTTTPSVRRHDPGQPTDVSDGSTTVTPPVLARGGTSTAAPPLAPPSTSGRLPVPASGAAPTGVTVTGVPMVANLSWNATPNAKRYAVWRGTGSAVSIERTPANFTATQFRDFLADPHEVYRYSVIAYYADGTKGEAPAVQFTSPPLVNPTGFTAVDRGEGGVDWQWQPVPDAIKYRLDGPGLPSTGYFTTSTHNSYPHVPGGPDTWRLTAIYAGNVGDTANGTTVSMMRHVLPPHSKAWLSHRNGTGSLAQVETPSHQEYNNSVAASTIGTWSGDLQPVYDPTYAAWLGQPMSWSDIFEVNSDPAATPCAVPDDLYGRCVIPGLKIWLNLFFSKLWDDPEQVANEAVYGNPGDLGVGRRAFCFQSDSVDHRGENTPASAGPYTVCYATAHGVPPGQVGFNDPQTITHPGEGLSSDFILSMVIVKDPRGTTFLVLGKNGKYPLLPIVRLDSEGPKYVPFACIACHGGTYNAATRKVDGSSFLPLDPNLLSFASPSDQAAQEEKIRKINFIIHKAQPQSAIAAYLNGLYHGAIGTPGTTAVPDYVPASWSAQAGFYRQVVRANCTMCHLAAPPSWNFASWQNFEDNKALIHADVCVAHTMPHAEVPFKNFWLKDTGIIYLPGLLASTLGYPSC